MRCSSHVWGCFVLIYQYIERYLRIKLAAEIALQSAFSLNVCSVFAIPKARVRSGLCLNRGLLVPVFAGQLQGRNIFCADHVTQSCEFLFWPFIYLQT